MVDKSRKELVEEYIEAYGYKVRLMAHGFAKMLNDNPLMYIDEMALYIKAIESEASIYRMYSEELDNIMEEEDAQ